MQTDYKDFQKLPKSDIWSLYDMFNVWRVCMQILQARGHEGILAKESIWETQLDQLWNWLLL